MASRSIASQLVRFLHGLTAPVCVFDEVRRVVFANQPCADWAAVPLDDLIGITAAYSAVAENGGPSAADRLCPPPGAFAGGCQSGLVYAVSENGLRRRQAMFHRLSQRHDGAQAPVIMVADASDLSAEEGAEDVTPLQAPTADEPQLLHDRLMRFRHNQIACYRLDRLVGDSIAMRLARSQARLGIASGAHVTMVGPPGSGREHLARAIHYSATESTRTQQVDSDQRLLLPLDGSLLTNEVLSSAVASLSHHSRSAAVTLLVLDLDSIAIELQAELVRLVGTRLATVRFLTTSQTSPGALLSQGRLHSHLAPALGTLVIRLPALAERREDIALLAQLAIEEINAAGRKQIRGLTAEALDALVAYSWPDNVAELRECVAEAFGRAEGTEITAADLPRRLFHVAEAARRPPRFDEPIVLEDFLKEIERELVERALKQSKGNKARAARLLGLTRPRLYRRMVQLGLEDAARAEEGGLAKRSEQPGRTERRRRRLKPADRKPFSTVTEAELDAAVPEIDEEPEYIENIPFEEQPE